MRALRFAFVMLPFDLLLHIVGWNIYVPNGPGSGQSWVSLGFTLASMALAFGVVAESD